MGWPGERALANASEEYHHSWINHLELSEQDGLAGCDLCPRGWVVLLD
jgi:hypothetical protein